MNEKTPALIAQNRRARHDYFIEHEYEAGMVLEGWEVKSLRQGKVDISNARVISMGGEVFLLGSRITPLETASTHTPHNPERTRKLLLNHREIIKLTEYLEQKGMTCVPLSLYWGRGRVKCKIAAARGKKLHDKRQALKEEEWKKGKAALQKRLGTSL